MSNEQKKKGVIDQLMAFFASLKLTIVLFLLLAGTSIFGTFIPQNADPRAYLQAFGEFLFRLFSVFGIFDIYHSWWFQLLIILLTLNITVCSIDRLSSIWKLVFKVKKRFIRGRFNNAPSEEFTIDMPFADFRQETETLVGSRYRHVETIKEEKEATLFGERWRWSRLGVYIVHLSVVLLLLGSLVGSIFGFDGFVQIPEGETVDSIHLRGRSEALPLPFQIRCDDFNVRFYENGAPDEFRSDLVIIENGQETLKKSIIVNDPLRYKGINIFQSSYGELRNNPMMGGPKAPENEEAPVTDFTEALLQVMVNETGMAYQVPVKLGEPVDLPEKLGQFTYTGLIPHAKFGGQDIGEALAGILTKTGGEPEEILLSIRFASFDKMRQGKLFITVLEPNAETLAEKDIHSHSHAEKGRGEKAYWTGLEVTRDPGVPLVYLGFCLMIAGCFVAFFMPHEQVMITISKRGQKSAVVVAGTAYRNRIAMQQKVKRLAIQLGAEKTVL